MEFTASQNNVVETEKYYKNTSISNIGGYLLFNKQIEIDILKKAINKLIENADALRMCLVSDAGKTEQIVHKYEYENVPIVRLAKNNVEEITTSWMKEIFDLYEKMYEFKILKIDNEYGLFIKIHHLVSDAWSISLIVSKILEYYDKLLKNEEIEKLPNYEDAIIKSKQYLSSTQFEKDEIYWNEKYENKPTYISMSKNQGSVECEAERESFVISEPERKNIEEYCEKNNISMAVFFEAIVSLYAMRINNSDDITLCSLVVNRSGAVEKNTIGMFNNILPLTFNADWNMSFIDFCNNISNEHMKMFRHQKYPYSNIVDMIRKKHGTSNIYDIMVSYQNAKMNIASDMSYQTHWCFNGCCELGFMVNIDDINDTGKLFINIDYRKSSFTGDEVRKIYARFMHIIEQAIENESVLFKDIQIVTEDEKKQILVDFNSTYKEYPKEKRLYDFLEENAIKNPNKNALYFENESMTYEEFNKKVNSVANYIIQNGVHGNAIIGVMMERSFEMLIALYAALKAGCAYMPMDPHFPDERISFMLEDSESPLILTMNKWNSKLPNNIQKLNLDEFDYTSYSDDNLNIEVSSKDTAYVIYTSGSTGKPKGAQIPHHSAINRIKWMHEKYPLEDGDVILQKTPYTFDVSVWELFWWSMYDGSLKILIPEGHKDPKEIIDAIYEAKVTHMHFVPSMLNAFLQYLNANRELIKNVSSLKYVFASGEALQSEQVKKFYNLLKENNTTLHNLYGPTECTVDVSYYDCDKNNIPAIIPIGKPVDNTQLLVLDKACNLLPSGVSGELHISGVLVGKGYINRAELTKEKFVKNLYYDFDTMYKTGDLAQFLPDGNIEYLGRIDNQIKIRGLRVELGDIENAISKYQNVFDVVVSVIEVGGEKNLCAYFTAGTQIKINELKKEISKNLPDYMVPTYYVQLEKMPLNANGKADRKALPMPEINDFEEYVAPANELEEKIQKCVQRVLKRERVGVETDLLNYGLTSLGVITIITDLSALGINVKVKDFYEARTIRVLTESLGTSMQLDDNYSNDDKYRDITDIRRISIDSKTGGNILLTGATGFLGIHLLEEIINNTDKVVYCLIRKKDKFDRFLERYTTISKDCNRVMILKGDIIDDNLGMTEKMYKKISEDVSTVIHSAANVSYFCSWEKASQVNYLGTCNVIKFAEQANAKLHHISTMSVSGDVLTAQTEVKPNFTEDKLYIGQKYKDNVYAHSKYLAEREVIKAIREMRINASIYRLPNLTWRMSDGAFQENFNENDLYIMTKVMRKLKMVPLELAPEGVLISPIDDLAKAIIRLVLEKNNNDVYHMISSYSPTVEKYIKTLCSDVKELPMIDIYKELQLHPENTEMQFVAMYLSGILEAPDKMAVNITSERTNKVLNDMGYNWNVIDDEYIRKIDDIH